MTASSPGAPSPRRRRWWWPWAAGTAGILIFTSILGTLGRRGPGATAGESRAGAPDGSMPGKEWPSPGVLGEVPGDRLEPSWHYATPGDAYPAGSYGVREPERGREHLEYREHEEDDDEHDEDHDYADPAPLRLPGARVVQPAPGVPSFARSRRS